MRAISRLRFVILVALLFFASPLLGAQKVPAKFPRDGAKKLQEGDCFVIWDVIWEHGKSTGMREGPLDQVTVFMTEGAFKITAPDGTWLIEEQRVGSVRFDPKGTINTEESLSDSPIHATVFQLKDVPAPEWPVTEGIPGQLPRAGAFKLFETARFIVWDHTFRTGVPAERHLHYHPTVGVYLEGGKTYVTSDSYRGVPIPPRVSVFEPGHIINITQPLKAPHTEQELEGSPHVIYVQLK